MILPVLRQPPREKVLRHEADEGFLGSLCLPAFALKSHRGPPFSEEFVRSSWRDHWDFSSSSGGSGGQMVRKNVMDKMWARAKNTVAAELISLFSKVSNIGQI